MNTNLRTIALSTALLMLATATVAPTAQAAEIGQPNLAISACTPPNPSAWVNACVSLNPTQRSVNAYTVDTTPPTTRVCPVNNVCANVPIIIGGLIVQSTIYYTLYNPSAQYNVNTNQIVDDICAVIGIVCPILQMLTATASTTLVPDVLAVEDVAAGPTFEGFTLDAAGNLSELVFSGEDGLVFLVPIAA